MRVNDKLYSTVRYGAAGVKIHVEAKRYSESWGVRLCRLSENSPSSEGEELIAQVFKDAELKDPGNGDAVLQEAWEILRKNIDV